MEQFEALYLWLLEWELLQTQAKSDQSWRRLGKGTKVSIVSTTSLRTICDQLKAAVRSQSCISEVQIDNSDICSEGKLRDEAEAGRDFEPIPSDVYERIFPEEMRKIAEVLNGWIVWDGLFSPKVFIEGWNIPVIICTDEGEKIYYVPVSGGDDLDGIQSKHEGKWVDEDEDVMVVPTWWSSIAPQDPHALLGELQIRHPSQMETMQALTSSTETLFSRLNSLILVGIYDMRRTTEHYVVPRYMKGVGFVNLGKTCFMNAALQSLLHIPQVVTFFLNQDEATLGSTAKLLVDLIRLRYLSHESPDSPDTPYIPDAIYDDLSRVHNYTGHRDEDASELFIVLLELLHMGQQVVTPIGLPEEIVKSEHLEWLKFIGSDMTVRGQVFGGLMRHKLQCCNCPSVSYCYAPFCMLPLNLPPAKHVHVSIVSQDLSKPQLSVKYHSHTSLEDNEILNNVRDLVLSHTNIEQLIVAEQKGVLVDSDLGLSNLVASSQFIALEVPELNPSEYAVLVDIWLREVPICTRVIKLPGRITLQSIGEEVAAYLIQVQESVEGQSLITGWIPSFIDKQAKRQQEYRDMLFGHSVLICKVDGSRSFEEIECFRGSGMNTVGEVYEKNAGKFMRVRFTCQRLSRELQSALKAAEPGKSIWTSILGDRQDSDLCVTVFQLLEYTLRDKPMNEEDSVLCSQCHNTTQRITATEISRLPQVLALVLQRARYSPSGLQKSHIRIQYPLENLDLSCFETGTIQGSALFTLQAVICHQGSGLSRGHYTSYVRSPVDSQWFYCDDEKVQLVEDRNDVVQEKTAYMLFYTRHQ